MELVKITDIVNRFGLSSRSLRYYEQIGLIRSVRPEFEKYRFYDAENISRLKQIIVLRKMQIPVKDIIRIYESEDMSTVVEAFVSRIREIDNEVNALSELKRVVSDFLQTMVNNGVTKISAIPLLYEEMGKQFELLEERKTVTYKDLNAIGETLAKPVEPAIISIPAMRVISSFLKDSPETSDTDGFWRWVQAKELPPGRPGQHERFDFQTESGEAMILRVPDDFTNDGGYLDYVFDGGLFATADVYLDEDLIERFRSLVSCFDGNKFYEADYSHEGSLRCPAMLENLISPDEKRELVSLLVPVKKRLPNAALFDNAEELTPWSITFEEIEEANPILWTKDVPMDKFTPILNPYYRVNEQGEAEYIPYIGVRLLSTDVKVKLPYRVDIEFKTDYETQRFGYGSGEGSMRFYHGENLRFMYGVNMDNHADYRISQEAIRFNQPVFGDPVFRPKVGKINQNEYNRLTWIVGEKHFAVIINDEVRYCSVNFPYMTADLRLQQALPIIIGSDGQGKIYIKRVRVSQLKQAIKTKIKKGALTMITKQSNNIIPNIHQLITMHYGENYWFNGCAKYAMECLGEKDYDYQFFAGLTGDNFAQIYAYNKGFRGDSATEYRMDEPSLIEDVFEKCGYASTFVREKQLRANKEMYLQTLMAYIDKGIPVIRYQWTYGVFVGYEDFGKTLLLLTSDKKEPERISLENALPANVQDREWQDTVCGWIFVGEKKEQREIKQIYRDAIINLPTLLTIKTDKYCFGAEALRTWAADIENGRFDGMKPEDFNGWFMHAVYVCNLATNSGGAQKFMRKALELNPDMTFLDDVCKQFRITGLLWNGQYNADDKFAAEYARTHENVKDNLEKIGGGFNITLEALQNKEKREKIAGKIREFADVTDEIVRLLNEGIRGQRMN